MQQPLVIAEKKSAAEALVKALSGMLNIAPRAGRNFYAVGNYKVTWLSGHVYELLEPEEYDPKYGDRRRDHLPIIPSPFKTKPTERGVPLIATVEQLLKTCDGVIGFCDPDREGQLLQDEVLINLGNTKPVTRLWASSLDARTLITALGAMKDNADYQGWYFAALARRDCDWLYGMNMSRAVTLAARSHGSSSKFPVGRVQTPTLALVVNREALIRSFVPVDFFVPWIEGATTPALPARWHPKKDTAGTVIDTRVDAEGRLLDSKVAQGIVAAIRQIGKAVVKDVATIKSFENPPLPFSLSKLQALCSRKYGLGAAQTLKIAEDLYLAKLTSYPRVDTEYLAEAQHVEAPAILASIAKASLPTDFGNALRGAKTALKSRAWNDKKVTAHHGIIPAHLENPADLVKLTETELKVYLEILRRYVLQFWPAAQFLKTTISLESAGESFVATGKRYTDEGWRRAFAAEGATDADEAGGDEDRTLPAVTKGQSIDIKDVGMDAQTTKPPKRFDQGALITAMENIHHFVQDPQIKSRLRDGAGIGTSATRAEIIDKLLRTGYINENDKKELIPSKHGELLVSALPTSMTTPDLTAMWQEFMDRIQTREVSYEAFMKKQVAWLSGLVQASDVMFDGHVFADEKPRLEVTSTGFTCFGEIGSVGCASALRRINGKFGWFFGCSNKDCGKMFRDVEGKPVEKGAPGASGSAGGNGAPSGSAAAAPPAGKKFQCAACGKGWIRELNRKDGSGKFWGCTGFRDGCKAVFNDVDGEPDLEGKTKRTGGHGGHSNAQKLVRT